MMSIKKLQVLDYKINADTLDDKHASDFASASDMTEAKDNIDDLQAKVGDESVSSQIATSIENKVDKVSGKGLSTNDYTTSEKNTLASVNTTVSDLKTKVGDTAVSTQISNYAAPKSHASSATTYGVSTASNYGHAKASATTPKANGTAAVGSETSSFARGDHVHPLQTSVSGNAGTATKLATARTITLAGGHQGSATFDGSVNITIDAWSKYITSSNGNTNNYPYHRFAKLNTITGLFQDRSASYIISGGYTGGGWGIFRLILRTNNTGSVSSCDVEWIVREKLSLDFIQVGLYDVSGKTYADAFIKTNGTWDSYTINLIESGSRGAMLNTWEFVQSIEDNNTTTSDPKTSKEVYVSIESAATTLHNQAYSQIIKGTDKGTVNTANSASTASSATKATQDASGNVITSTYATKAELSKVSTLVGDTSVSSQISSAVSKKADTVHTHSAATTSAAGFMSTTDKSKLDGITESADAVSFSRSLTSGTKVGTITINGTGTDLYAPTNTDTHYASGTIVGSTASATTNTTSALTNGNVYLNHIENGAIKNSHKISGSGATTVTTDASGNIIIKSTDNNTTYSAATTTTAGLMSAADKQKLDGIDSSTTKTTIQIVRW